MALINCPECGREISDKAKSCPNCGYELTSADVEAPNVDEIGKAITAEPDEHEPPKPRKKNPVVLAAAAVAVIAVIIAAVFLLRGANEKKYAEALHNARLDMLRSGADAEDLCGLVHSVWYNAIFKESDQETDKYTKPNGNFVVDFNDALFNLFVDADYMLSAGNLENKQTEIKGIVADLKDPPEKYEECYELIKEMYSEYNTLVTCATDPSGNITSYVETYREADSKFLEAYNDLELLLPLEDFVSTSD